MNRLSTLVVIGLAGLLAACGSSVTSSTQAPTNATYSLNVQPNRLTLNVGDIAGISAVVDQSTLNSAPKAVTPPPTIKFYSSDSRVSVSPSGSICAGQWDLKYELCSPSLSLPNSPVVITAYDNQQNVSGSTQVFVHPRAADITLSASGYPTANNCVSQNQSVLYTAQAFDSGGNLIPNCAVSNVAGCVNALDYTWTTADPTVAGAGLYGGMVARNPGVTSIYAKLNGTVSVPLAFATCPPAALVLESSAYNKGAAAPPYSTADMDSTAPDCATTQSCILQKGSPVYLTAKSLDINGNPMQLVDINGNPLDTLSLDFLSSSLLTGSFISVNAFTSRFTANTSGRTILSTSCTPPGCNPSISDFVAPTGTLVTAKSLGYGYPLYSNVIGASVAGSSSSTVLVTGTTFADGVTPVHRLLTYDTESLALTHTIELANLPNSLVVAPNGQYAYVGSSEGLVVVNLSSYSSAILTYPIVGDPINTDQITGTVLGVSPDSRYVLISDIPNGLVFLVDTTGSKNATRYPIPNIRAVTFATDLFDFWIGGDNGVYVYQGDTFVKTQTNISSNVTSLAWAADGQSYFASGSQLTNYSTCDDQNPQNLGAGPVNLASTAINGSPRIVGLAGSAWLDYSVTSSSQASNPKPVGNVCLSTVAVSNPPHSAPSTLNCTAQQFAFSPRLEQEFVTGEDSACATPETAIHGYDLGSKAEITLGLSTTSTSTFTPVPIVPLSGGILNDGRKLYVGTNDSKNGALLRRFDLASGAEEVVTQELLNQSGQPTTNPPTFVTVIPASVPLIPSYVAVVPK